MILIKNFNSVNDLNLTNISESITDKGLKDHATLHQILYGNKLGLGRQQNNLLVTISNQLVLYFAQNIWAIPALLSYIILSVIFSDLILLIFGLLVVASVGSFKTEKIQGIYVGLSFVVYALLGSL